MSHTIQSYYNKSAQPSLVETLDLAVLKFYAYFCLCI